MNHAVRIPGVQAIYFLTDPPDDSEGLDVEPGAWIEVPSNVSAWPNGTRRPDQVLCRSRKDPRHYKIFKYRDEVEGTEWEETGLQFGGTYSPSSWARFAEKIPAFRALHAIPDEEED